MKNSLVGAVSRRRARLAPVIRQLADRVANETLPRQLQRVSKLAAASRPAEMKDGPPVQYLSARLIPIVYSKAILESEDDLDAYLVAVKKTCAQELKSKRRIML